MLIMEAPAPRQHHLQLQPPSSLRQQSSFAQFSSRSNEADDERSEVCSTITSMGPGSADGSEERHPAAYEGEDTRPTSRKELLGFYAYSFAAEVFVICGLGAFIPITLEDLARASPSAVLASDPTRSCKAKVGIPEVASTLLAHGSHGGKHPNNQCVFHFLGLEINTASFAMYTFSVSVLLQALAVVTMSGAADHGRFRKTLLLVFAVIGAVATMLFLPVKPSAYLLGSLWAIIGNVCFGASFVLLNSFLPLLVRHHPEVLEREVGEESERHNGLEVSQLMCILGSITGEAFFIRTSLVSHILSQHLGSPVEYKPRPIH